MINLTLHGIGTPSRPLEYGEDHVWLAPDVLEAILDELPKYKNFVLTVDDANESDVEILLPALVARKLTAIFFITAGKLDLQGYLEHKDIKTLVQKDMEIGTHGMHHRDWRKLDNSELSIEIDRSKDILEETTGQEISKVSCPYGSYDRRVLRYLRNAKFKKIYTSDRGRTQNKWWIQPRNSLQATDNPKTLKTIMSQPNSLGESFMRNSKSFIKRWR